jgi:glycosyltransferase involved in cell wall biosynthesis
MPKPKLAIISNHENSAIDIVMESLIPFFRTQFEVTKFYPTEPFPKNNFEDFDLVHVGWVLLTPYEIVPPVTANVWSLSPFKNPQDPSSIGTYTTCLMQVRPDRLIVDDIMSLQLLGQIGWTRTTLIPLAFDCKFTLLPYPEEFTIGYFGNNYPGKRFDVIEAAAGLAGVPLAGYKFSPDRSVYVIDPLQVYESMSVYVHASFQDTNSMPCMEALKCGRPIISTHNHGLERVMDNEYNGYWFDGSAEDLVKKIELVQEREVVMRESAERTILPKVESSAVRYLEVFNEVLNS